MGVELYNSRGQLGGLLKKYMKEYSFKGRYLIYHTWNIDDKSKEIQFLEYEKFLKFVDNNKNNKIIFISTKSEKDSWYVYYKQLSESYLIQNCENCLIFRFPTIVGYKGTIQLLKKQEIEPYGIMELMSLDNVCKNIINNLDYCGKSRILSFDGEKITAYLTSEILKI